MPHRLSQRLLTSALFLFLIIFSPSFVHGATQSLYDSPIWKSQRNCARDCFWWGGGDYLAGKLSCGKPVEDACYCRPDLQPSAKSVLSYCISTWCGAGATVDITSATSMYGAYCEGQLATTVAEASTTPTTRVLAATSTIIISSTQLTTAGIGRTSTGTGTSVGGQVTSITVMVTPPAVTKVLVSSGSTLRMENHLWVMKTVGLLSLFIASGGGLDF